MTVLGRDAILGAPLKSRTIDIPEWGGSVRIKEMTAIEREAFEEAIISTNGTNPALNKGNIRGWMASFSLVDEDGNRLFSSADDVAALGKTSGTALTLVCSEIQEMNAIGEKEVEELAEDFVGDPGSDSTTG